MDIGNLDNMNNKACHKRFDSSEGITNKLNSKITSQTPKVSNNSNTLTFSCMNDTCIPQSDKHKGDKILIRSLETYKMSDNQKV